jgi:hypothetical protein
VRNKKVSPQITLIFYADYADFVSVNFCVFCEIYKIWAHRKHGKAQKKIR